MSKSFELAAAAQKTEQAHSDALAALPVYEAKGGSAQLQLDGLIRVSGVFSDKEAAGLGKWLIDLVE